MRIMSEKLKQRRMELGYSVTYVAEALGISESTLERYEVETARKKITPKMISELAQVLKCSPSAFMDWESPDPNKKKDDERKGMFTLYDGHTYQVAKFPKAAQDELRHYVESLMKKYNIEK